MKVTKDPFYAECFPGGSEEEGSDKPETPIDNIRPEIPSSLEIASEGNMFMEEKTEEDKKESQKVQEDSLPINVDEPESEEEQKQEESLPEQLAEEKKLGEGESDE